MYPECGWKNIPRKSLRSEVNHLTMSGQMWEGDIKVRSQWMKSMTLEFEVNAEGRVNKLHCIWSEI